MGRRRRIDPDNRDEVKQLLDDNLIDAAQAAELIGLHGPTAFHTYGTRFTDWPVPIADHGSFGKLYWAPDVDAFLERHPGVGRRRREGQGDDKPPAGPPA